MRRQPRLGFGSRIVGQRVEVRQVVADRGEGARLILPVLGEIGFAAGRLAHAFKDGGRYGLILGGAGC